MQPQRSFLFKLIALQLVLLCGLGAVNLIPENPSVRQSMVSMDLPETLNGWNGTPIEPSELEIESLAEDTEFEKMRYMRIAPEGIGEFDEVVVSMVLSGNDVNDSIHRPERCLPAQGNAIEEHGTVTVKLGNNESLDVTRIMAFRQQENGDKAYFTLYYWFVGADSMTNSHYKRTFVDIRDRVVKGTNQRWAYVTVQVSHDGNRILENGLLKRSLPEESANKLLSEMTQTVYPYISIKTED